MLKGAVAQRYAQALFDIALEQDLMDKLESDLREVLEALEGSRDLSRVFYHPQVPTSVKKIILKEIFAEQISPVMLNFLSVLLDARREFFLKAVAEEFVRMANATKNIVEATVTSAVPIPLVNRVNLMDALTKMTGKEIRIQYQEDPEILGGLVIRIGDRIIDAGVKGRLERIREQIRETQVG